MEACGWKVRGIGRVCLLINVFIEKVQRQASNTERIGDRKHIYRETNRQREREKSERRDR